MSVTTRRYNQMRFLLKHLLAKYTCYFCKEPLAAFPFEAKYVHDLTIHHIDGDHDNDDPSNTWPAHRKCHRSHHMKEMRAKQEAEKKALVKKLESGEYLDPVYCEHANEVPAICRCPDNCYCMSN